MKKQLQGFIEKPSIETFVTHYKSAEMSLSSIAVAYYLLLTVFPFLMLLANIFPYLHIDTSDLMVFLRDNLPEQLYENTATIIQSVFNQPSSSFLWLSIGTGFWTMSRSLNFLQQAFNKAYGVQDHRDFVISYAVGLLSSIIVTMLLAIAILLSTFGKTILRLIHTRLQLNPALYSTLLHVTQPLTALIFFLALAFLYYLLPNVRIKKLRYILPGTLFSSLVLISTTSLFGQYVNYTMERLDNLRNFSSITTFVIMLWFIFFSRVLIMGAIFNATYQKKATGTLDRRRGDVLTLIQSRKGNIEKSDD